MVTVTIGSESTGKVLIPVADGVLCRLLEIKPNRFNANRLDFPFQIIDMDYEDGDDEDNATIQDLASQGYIHFESVNLPDGSGPLGKGTKFYKLLKGMSGGKEIEEGAKIELSIYESKDFRIDFEHIDKQAGPPDFAVVYDDKGKPVKKSSIGKIRPARKAKAPAKPVAPTVDDDEDDDLLED